MKKKETSSLAKLWIEHKRLLWDERHRMCGEEKTLVGDCDPLITQKSISGTIIIAPEFMKQCLGNHSGAGHNFRALKS